MNTVTITETKNTISVNETTNTVTIQEGQATVVTVATEGPQGPAFADGDIGDIVISDGGTVATIDAGAINNAKVASDAAIAGSKLQASSGSNSGTMSAANFTKLAGVETGATADQTASEIKTLLNSDGLTNSQISGSAAIAGTKISPDFGSQNITSTGNISANAVSGASFSGNGASITNIDAANIASGQIASARVPTLNQNTTGSAATLTTARTIAGVSFDGSANIDISYANLTNKLTVGDGGLTQNNFTDTLKTKLDGVAVGATNVTNTNQLTNGAGFITASDGITGNAASATVLATARTIAGASFDGSANIDISYTDLTNKLTVGDGGLTQNNFTNTLKTKLDGIETNAINASNTAITDKLPLAGGTLTGELTISSATPIINLTDTNNDSDYQIKNGNGDFNIKDTTNDANRLTINSSGTVDVAGNLDVGSGLDVTGNITVTGTVDGVDVAARNTLFGGLTSSSGVLSNGVTATTQSASDNSTKVATTAYADTAVANLVDSAPGTLNTLNELAAALGDDPNFATTVTNSIATKLPLAGGQITGNITCSGSQTFDGRDLSVDGAKLDGIESGATADQTKSDIDALGIAASTATTLATARTIAGVSFDGSADISLNNNAITNGAGYITATLTNEQVQDIVGGMLTGNTETGITVTYQDGDGTIDFVVGTLNQDTTGNAATATALETARTIAGTSFDGSANIDISYTNLTNKLSVGDGGLTQNNFTDALKTKLDGIETGATADQTASEIVALVADQTIAPSEIDMEDNEKIKLGTGEDLELYHDSTNSLIDNGTGDLYINSAGGIFIAPNNDEAGVYVRPNGAVELYYDNSIKFRTWTDGVIADESIWVGTDNKKLLIGGGFDLQLYHDGTENFINSENGNIRIRNSAEDMMKLIPNGAVELYHDNSKKLETTSSGVEVDGQLEIDGSVGETILKSSGAEIEFTRAASSNITCSNASGSLKIITGGSDSMLIDSSGNVQIPNDTVFLQIGAGQDLDLHHNGTNSYIRNKTGDLRIRPLVAEEGIILKPNAAVELYYDNVKQFETASIGVYSKSIMPSSHETYDIGQNMGRWNNIYIADSGKLRIGQDDDLQIYHSGTYNRNYIQATGTNHDLTIAGDEVAITNSVISETLAKFIADGAVELFYDGSKKLETISWGARVTGNLDATGSVDTNELTINGTTVLNSSRSLYNLGVLELADNIEARFGSGTDLKIVHDGSNSYLTHSGTGNLYIDGDTDDLVLQAGDDVRIQTQGNEDAIQCLGNGGVELFYDNSKKFETKSYGAFVTGYITASPTSGNLGFHAGDDTKMTFGAGDDLQIYHNGSNSFITNNTGQLQIRSDQLGMTPNDGSEYMFFANKDGNVELYYDGSKKFESTSAGVEVSGNVTFAGDSNTHISHPQADYLKITTGGNEVMSFTDASNIFVPDSRKLMFGDNVDLQIYHNGTDSIITNSTGDLKITDTSDDITITAADDIRLRPQGGENGINVLGNGAVELFYDNSKKLETTSSGVTVTGTVTETSDIALKSNIEPLNNALEKIKQITGYKYNLNSQASMGVIAQDVEKVLPELVHGFEGKKSLQYSGLIGVLVEAVKELSAKVAALEAA